MPRKLVAILAVVLLLILAASVAMAQSETPASTDAADAAADEALPAFITLNLDAAQPLDPFFMSVNGGGAVEASSFAEGCTGYVNANPTVSLNWSGESDFVEAFFHSDHDPVLVIQLPDGSYVCNDDANAQLLDPVVQMDNPEQGAYHIWVGSYAANQLIPGVLVLTTRPEVNVGTFSLGNLVRRAAIAEDLVEVDELQVGRTLIARILENLEARGVSIADLAAGLGDTVQALTVEGTIPAFDIPHPDGLACNGFITEDPNYVFDWEGESEHLRILFEGDRDASLIVITPDGSVICRDDAQENGTLNPLVGIDNPVAGRYSIYVGRLNPGEPVNGNLIITESADLLPALLEAEGN